MDNENKIVESWRANAANWIATIDGNEIESRNMVTNAAIVDTIVQYRPLKVLDIGCGEGWLTRKLLSVGIDAHGIDAIKGLIENAVAKGGKHYSLCSYEGLMNNECTIINDVDSVVINFALLDKDVTDKLILYLGNTLKQKSLLFVQTLHPLMVALTQPYKSSWMDGSWNGLTRDFSHPYQWYFRTFEDWIKLFTSAGLTLVELKEPLNSVTHKPASLIFVLAV